MGDKLNEILGSLNNIKTNLFKSSYERRQSAYVQKKVDEAKVIFGELKGEVAVINRKINASEVEQADILLVKDIVEKIKRVYEEILAFGQSQQNTNKSEAIMASFDIKVVSNLLPVLNDSEENTKKLIEAAEFYNSTLKNEDKEKLINFILKTRLSSNAKLRLKTTYNSLETLVTDIKTYLLTRKSPTALQAQLFSIKQSSRSIEEFGKELEDLFVGLTISQANDDPDIYEILRPINEKSAIKRFANGLRSQRLSTIISARNFEYLKDAIKEAQDEENSFLNDGNQVFNMSHRGRGNSNRNSYRGFNRARSSSGQFNNNNSRNNNYANFNNNSQRFVRNGHFNRGSRNFRGQRFQGNRGRPFNPRSSDGARGFRHNVNFAFAEQGLNVGEENNTHQTGETFFRP